VQECERNRIEAAGGTVLYVKGSWRVILPDLETQMMKVCACSRGLGDADFKARHLIASQPEVLSTLLLPRADTCSIFASDGVWNYVDDQTAVDVVAATLAEFSEMSLKLDLHAVAAQSAKKLINKALDAGSVDDISVVVNIYDWAPDASLIDDTVTATVTLSATATATGTAADSDAEV